MHVNYEYILAGMILLLILSVAELNIFSIMRSQLAKMEQKTDYPNAERILDTLLLSPGYPSNWGSSKDPISLGLALQNSLRSYVLDLSKVVRLTPEDISPTEARRLMGLSSDYHFNLTIVPVFTVEITNSSTAGNMRYDIVVRDYKGFRVPNANVTGFYVPGSLTGNELYPSVSAVASSMGTCNLNFGSLTPVTDSFLVVSINHLGVKALQTYPSGRQVLVEGGYVLQSEYPMIQTLKYETGSVFTPTIESASRYVEIGEVTYYAKFDLWR